MPATTNNRAIFFSTKTGVPHKIAANWADDGACKTAAAKARAIIAAEGSLDGYAGLSAEAVIALEKDCKVCSTQALAKSYGDSPAKRRSAAKDKADATRASAAGTKTTTRKASTAKPAATEKPTKEVKATAPKAEKLDAAGKNKAKAQAMADAINAAKSGWNAVVTNGGPRVLVTAKNGDQTLVTTFVDGKLDLENMPTLSVGEWSGTLRNVSAVLIQTDAKESDVPKPFPHPGSGRAKRTRETAEDEVEPTNEGPELEGMDDDDVLARVIGKTISWRNTTAKMTETAIVPNKSKMTKITIHPKSGKRMLNFAPVEEVVDGVEKTGGLRTVALVRISNVA